ncbi:hypothetical protein SNE40_015736 [Patella caerulea]|uniref:Uncharacterized protein n=1 Tax=Patella caerulea TaxID=87958 RepID=A0AAN8JPQ8_PATCE
MLYIGIILYIFCDLTNACYEFPPGIPDPCEGEVCTFGAKCIPSIDGSSHRCVCPDRCDTFGDSLGSTPVCGSNGVDYNNMCELHRAACNSMKEIRVKYYGKCGMCLYF